MKKLLLLSLLGFLFLAGCGSKSSWQGTYYDGWNADSDIVYWPIFTNYEGCKNWAINMMSSAYNNYAYCAKNCYDSVAGTPICEDVVRTWQPLPWSNTFDNYKE